MVQNIKVRIFAQALQSARKGPPTDAQIGTFLSDCFSAVAGGGTKWHGMVHGGSKGTERTASIMNAGDGEIWVESGLGYEMLPEIDRDMLRRDEAAREFAYVQKLRTDGFSSLVTFGILGIRLRGQFQEALVRIAQRVVRENPGVSECKVYASVPPVISVLAGNWHNLADLPFALKPGEAVEYVLEVNPDTFEVWITWSEYKPVNP